MSSKKKQVGNPQFLALLDELREIHIKKSAGYAGMGNPDAWANFRQAEGFGVSAFLGCLIRMSDKFIRIQNLVKNPKNEQVGESIRDTLKDFASYALIAVCLWDEMVSNIIKRKNDNKKTNRKKNH